MRLSKDQRSKQRPKVIYSSQERGGKAGHKVHVSNPHYIHLPRIPKHIKGKGSEQKQDSNLPTHWTIRQTIQSEDCQRYSELALRRSINCRKHGDREYNVSDRNLPSNRQCQKKKIHRALGRFINVVHSGPKRARLMVIRHNIRGHKRRYLGGNDPFWFSHRLRIRNNCVDGAQHSFIELSGNGETRINSKCQRK